MKVTKLQPLPINLVRSQFAQSLMTVWIFTTWYLFPQVVSVGAQPTGQGNWWQQEEALNAEATYVSDTCEMGAALTVSVDTSNLDIDVIEINDIYDYCVLALQAIDQLCSVDYLGKQVVRNTISTVVCTFGAQQRISLVDSRLVLTISWVDQSDLNSLVQEYLLGLPEANAILEDSWKEYHKSALKEDAWHLVNSCAPDTWTGEQPPISVDFDWTNLDFEQAEEEDASGYCADVLRALGDLCAMSSVGYELVQELVNSVVCTFGDERAITLRGTELVFTISWSSLKVPPSS